jgi:hypothetical protein
MHSIPSLVRHDDSTLPGDLRDVVAPWSGVLRATLIGACSWAMLLGWWLA